MDPVAPAVIFVFILFFVGVKHCKLIHAVVNAEKFVLTSHMYHWTKQM